MTKKIVNSLFMLMIATLMISAIIPAISAAPDDWSVGLTATLGTYSDLSIFGVNTGATNGFDAAYDQIDPPPSPGSGMVSYFYYSGNPISPVNMQKLSTSIIPPTPLMTWTYRLTPVSVEDGELTITWGSITENLVFTLQGPNAEVVNMRETTQHSFAAESDTTYTLTITVEEITAPEEYSLIVNVVGTGGVIVSPDLASYEAGTQVELTAVETDADWKFVGWSGDLSGSANPETITMDGNKSVTATFAEVQKYSLIVNVVGTGGVIVSPDLASYEAGTQVELTAVETDADWKFVGWSGDLSGSANPETITMDGNKSVTATFAEVQKYSLIVNVVGTGGVIVSPDLASYEAGTQVELTAVETDADWKFVGWSGDLSGSANPETITMDGNKSVTATFAEVQKYSLIVNVVGTGGVIVSPDLASYEAGTQVELTAVETDADWKFVGWSGDLSGSANPETITMDGNKSVTATFAEIPPGEEYSLTVNIVGSGSVAVNGSSPYAAGSTVQLTANPAAGWTFSGWSGDLSGSVNPEFLLMDSNKSVTATFAEIPPGEEYSLTVNIVGSGSVAVNGSSPYAAGSTVQLTANPAAGWTFSGWSGDLSGSVNPEFLLMDSNKSVTATFAEIPPGEEYSLTVNIVGSGSVAVNGSSPYAAGSTVQLTANPAAGWTFSGWSGDLSGSVNPEFLLMDSNKSVTATFAEIPPGEEYSLTVNIVGSGSVAVNGSSPYAAGSTVQLTANPAAGWTFSGWSGDLSGSVNPEFLLMDSNKSVTATFNEIPPQQEVHDVEAVSQTVTDNEAEPGDLVDVYVTVENPGDYEETFDVTCYYDGVEISTIRVENLAPGESRVVTFTWDTAGVPLNEYDIKAWADSSTEIVEVDEDNNWCTMRLKLFVIPEVPLGTIVAALSMFIALIGYVGFKRYRTK